MHACIHGLTRHLCARAIQIAAATEVSKLITTAIHFHGLSALCR